MKQDKRFVSNQNNEETPEQERNQALAQNPVTLIASENCWMEQNAINQLNALRRLPGVLRVVGLPDLHAGRSPIGVAVETEGILYPHLLGNDIGCGMGLFRTGIQAKRFKQERFVTRLNHIRRLEDLPVKNPYPEESPIYDLGTIGGGNHFAEFQTVERIEDRTLLPDLGREWEEEVLLLIHSGSRGYGQRIAASFSEAAGVSPGIPTASDLGREYTRLHHDALLWAERNRLLVAEQLVEYLGFEGPVTRLLDCPHNFLEEREDGRVLHRKGAVSAENHLVVIPGSRGSLTYLAAPAVEEERLEFCLRSLSHGAGRKWARSLCKSRLRDKYDRDSIRRTGLKSQVVCHDTELLYQEAPEAYKNVEQVIGALEQHGLLRIVATLRPRITYKG